MKTFTQFIEEGEDEALRAVDTVKAAKTFETILASYKVKASVVGEYRRVLGSAELVFTISGTKIKNFSFIVSPKKFVIIDARKTPRKQLFQYKDGIAGLIPNLETDLYKTDGRLKDVIKFVIDDLSEYL